MESRFRKECVEVGKMLAEELYKKERENKKDNSPKDSLKTQLKKLRNVAAEAESWEEIELYLMYQGSRDQINKDWIQHAIQELVKIYKSAGPGNHKEGLRRVERTLGYARMWYQVQREWKGEKNEVSSPGRREGGKL